MATVTQAKLKQAYDYIVVGSGASGAIIAGELSKTGADVLVIESGGEGAGPTVTNPSIWFYNVGARSASGSFGHAVGTAKIGTDADAVVDSKLRVHGLRGLRVADASVMPSIVSGPGTNAAAYMIGGRAAEMIKAES
jgi:choline dehydrogenase-like flavoprotein